MKPIDGRRYKLAVRNFCSVPTEDGQGSKSLELPTSEEEIDVVIDWRGIVNLLGRKAAKSKSGKSRALGGLVTVWHVRNKKGGKGA